MLSLLATLIILGLVFYIVNMIPMAEPFPAIVRVVSILIAVVLILNFLGIDILPLQIR